jgi:hypothetical protein
MKKWALGIAMALAGATLIALAVIPGLFSVAPKFNDLTTNFKPEMKASVLAELRTDLNGLSAAQSQFTTQTVPALATALGMAPAQLSATMQQQFPATSAGMAAVPTITTRFNQVLTILNNERSNFAQADSIPTASIAPTVIPWVLVVVGLVVMGCAVFARRWWRAGLAVVIGAVMIATPLALSLPGKASAADTMNVQMRPVFTAQTVASAKQSLATMDAMGAEMQTTMLPALGQMLGMQTAQFEAYLAGNFPALGAALSTLPASMTQFTTLVTAFDRSLTDYDDINSTQFTPIVWTILATGGFLLLVGLLGVADLARRRQSSGAIVAES